MQKSNLIKLFRTLSSKDIRSLRKFVRSPFFNQREDVILLFDYIVKVIDGKEDLLSKELAFQYVFPKKKFDDSLIRYAMSFLLKASKEYLMYEEMTSSRVQNQINLSRSLRRRGLDQLFEKEWKQAKVIQEKQLYRNTQYHHDNYQLYQERLYYVTSKKRKGDGSLQLLSDELTHFYVAEMLRQNCTILTHQTMSQKDYDTTLLEEVISIVEQGNYLSVPSIAIYYHSYMALKNKDDQDHFEKVKALIADNWKKFPTIEIRDIYILAINYCIKRLNSGERQKYTREVFELYKSGIKNEILLVDGFLSRFTYKNAVTAGMILKEFSWAEKFLETYKSYLHPDERKNTYLYNLANFYFRKPDYNKAMELLQRVNFKEVLYGLDSRRMLLRIYFEMEEFDALSSLLDSLKMFIHRHKSELGYHKKNYLNLIRFIKKILSVNISDKSIKSKLREEVLATPDIVEREWLLKQLE